MANSLLITKLSDDSFSFVVNGDTVNTIINLRNDMTTVGNEAHFKSSNGANLIKLQQILFNEVTIVDGGTLPVATSPIDLRIKLRSVGFWDWMNSGGSGVDRFDELADTFKYFGNDGKIPVVDESQLKLVPVDFPNVSYLNLFPNPLVANKGLKVNSLATAYEFYDIVNLITQDIRENFTETTPSEDAVFKALDLKLNTGGYNGSAQDIVDLINSGLSEQLDFEANGTDNFIDIGTTQNVKAFFYASVLQEKSMWNQAGSIITFSFVPLSGDGVNNLQFI